MRLGRVVLVNQRRIVGRIERHRRGRRHIQGTDIHGVLGQVRGPGVDIAGVVLRPPQPEIPRLHPVQQHLVARDFRAARVQGRRGPHRKQPQPGSRSRGRRLMQKGALPVPVGRSGDHHRRESRLAVDRQELVADRDALRPRHDLLGDLDDFAAQKLPGGPVTLQGTEEFDEDAAFGIVGVEGVVSRIEPEGALRHGQVQGRSGRGRGAAGRRHGGRAGGLARALIVGGHQCREQGVVDDIHGRHPGGGHLD